MAHDSTFREELAIAYPTYGTALWEPDPMGQYDAIEVGDVGFIRRGTGYFQRLFNVLHHKDHPSHRNPCLVPEDHEQLQPISGHILKGKIRTGSRKNSHHFCSKHVTLVSVGRGPAASRPEDDSQVTFSCNGGRGALLSLPVSAQSEDTAALGDFGNWMVKHIDSWFAFARGLGLGINRMEDIILVTGRHLAKSWINVAFTQRRPDAGVSFDIQVYNDSQVHLEQEHVHGGELKLGPTGKDLPEDQCIFVRGFRVVRILGMWPRLRGQAGPPPSMGGDGPEPQSDTQLELISVPNDTDYQDPLHVLLRYISEQAPDCDMALVHDDDLGCIDSSTINSHDLIEHLRNSVPEIQQFQCDSSPRNKGVSITKVATLSQHAFESPHKRRYNAPVASSGRPDKVVYDDEQERITAEIDLRQEKLTAVREKIFLVTHDRSRNEIRSILRAQLEDLRSQQSSNKTSRNEIFDQIKTLRDRIQKRVKDLQAAREKARYRTVEEVDAHIRNLEKQVDSGSMKVAEETRALQTIGQARRIRKTVESFQADSAAIDADRAAIDELKKQLDGHNANAISEQYEAIKAELDEIKQEEDGLYMTRSQLFEERRSLQQEIDTLFSERRESTLRFREANEQYYEQFDEGSARGVDRKRTQREAEEEKKRKARVLQLREEASRPAFQVQIDECRTLIDYFSTTPIASRAKAGYTEPKLETRQVELAPDNFVPLKKKGEGDDYFVGGKGKSKAKKGPKVHNTTVPEATPSSSNLNVPFGTLTALLSLTITPPSSQTDVPRVIEDLKAKKAWFEENQVQLTAKAMARAEAEIQHLMKGKEEPEDSSTLKVTDNLKPLSDTEAGMPNEQQKTGASSGSSRHPHDPGTGTHEKWEEQAGRRPRSQRQSNRGRASTRGGRQGSPSQRKESKDGSMGQVLVPGAISKTQAIQQLKANKATRRPGKGPGKKAQET